MRYSGEQPDMVELKMSVTLMTMLRLRTMERRGRPVDIAVPRVAALSENLGRMIMRQVL